MTDYRDGKWYEWHGGDCPVHPKDTVAVEFSNTDIVRGEKAEDWTWNTEPPIVRITHFRVTKKHVEPVAVVKWANDYRYGHGGAWHSTREAADKVAGNARIGVIRRTMIDGKVVSYELEEV